jgi:hypothetical protein
LVSYAGSRQGACQSLNSQVGNRLRALATSSMFGCCDKSYTCALLVH